MIHARLHPSDAQMLWMSGAIPNDQFLLYCFDTDAPARSVRDELLRNAGYVEDLHVRFDDSLFGYPRIRSTAVDSRQIVSHGSAQTWDSCLEQVSRLFSSQLEPRDKCWRVHVFDAVVDAPRCSGPALVVVLQISHALGDGQVASTIARRLFGDRRAQSVECVQRQRLRPREFLIRATGARELAARLEADTAAGLVPPQAPGRPRTRVNVAPAGRTTIRTAVRNRTDFTAPGITVTVGALTVVSLALQRYFTTTGDDVPAGLGAEVTFAAGTQRRARNHFRNAGVGLHPDCSDIAERAHRIAADIAARRARAAHPATTAEALATESTPAFVLRWAARQFDATAVPPTVTGTTVVSSVARGSADLWLGGGPVRFTAGFPALSPVMGITHGVHGIGETVTVSTTSAASAVPDPDAYAAILRAAADDVAIAMG